MLRIATSCIALGLVSLAVLAWANPVRVDEAAPPQQAVRLLNLSSPQDGVVMKTCVNAGDTIVPGTLLAQLDDRLAVVDRDIKQARVTVRKAEYQASVSGRNDARKTHDTWAVERRRQTEDEIRQALLSWERIIAEAYARKEAIRVAECELKRAEMVLEMHRIKSPVGGVVKAILKQPGEAVQSLETIVQLERFQQ